MTITYVVNDLRNLSREAGTLRLLAIIDFSLIIGLLLLLVTFSSFSSLRTRLFFMSAPHVLLAAVAGLASLQLGLLVYISLGLAAVCWILDVIQWWLRVLVLDFDLLELLSIIVVTVFIVIDSLYFILLYRVRVTDEAQNVDLNEPDARTAILEQKANTLRVAGLVGFVATLLALFICTLTLFSSRLTRLTLFSIGHLLVAPYAILLAERSAPWMIGMLVAGTALLALDVTQIVLRFIDIRNGVLTTLTGTSLFTVPLLLLTASLILVDLIYMLASASWLYVHYHGPSEIKRSDIGRESGDEKDVELASTTSSATTRSSSTTPSLAAWSLHQRHVGKAVKNH